MVASPGDVPEAREEEHQTDCQVKGEVAEVAEVVRESWAVRVIDWMMDWGTDRRGKGLSRCLYGMKVEDSLAEEEEKDCWGMRLVLKLVSPSWRDDSQEQVEPDGEVVGEVVPLQLPQIPRRTSGRVEPDACGVEVEVAVLLLRLLTPPHCHPLLPSVCPLCVQVS